LLYGCCESRNSSQEERETERKEEEKEKVKMLAVFKGTSAVIICQVNEHGKPIGADEYFDGDTGYELEDFDMDLVEAPVCVRRGGLTVEEERIIDLSS
jgi:hypothetical protein